MNSLPMIATKRTKLNGSDITIRGRQTRQKGPRETCIALAQAARSRDPKTPIDFRVFDRRCGFSFEIVASGLHQADEGVLQTRFNLLPGIGFPSEGGDCPFYRLGVASAYVKLVAEGGDLLDARQRSELRRESAKLGAGNFPRGQARRRQHVAQRSLGQQLS